MRIVRPLIDLQHVFHVGNKGRAGVRRDHPFLLAMRFENVFLGLLEIEWVIAGIVSADKLVDRGFLEV